MLYFLIKTVPTYLITVVKEMVRISSSFQVDLLGVHKLNNPNEDTDDCCSEDYDNDVYF